LGKSLLLENLVVGWKAGKKSIGVFYLAADARIRETLGALKQNVVKNAGSINVFDKGALCPLGAG